MAMNKEYSLYALLLLAFSVSVCLFGLASYPLMNGQEAFTASIAKEMYLYGHHLFPSFHGYATLESPPLFYWMLELVYEWLGVSTFSARLLPALLTLSTCLIIIHVTYRMHKFEIGAITIAMLCSSLGFVLLTHSVLLDTALITFTVGVFGYFYLWLMHNRKLYLTIAYGFIGLSVLTIGFYALLMHGLIMIWIVLRNKEYRYNFKGLIHWQPLLCLFSIVLPWYIKLYFTHPGLLLAYLQHDKLIQQLSGQGVSFHEWGFNLVMLAGGLFIYPLPWSLILPVTLLSLAKKRIDYDPLIKCALSYLMGIFLLLSIFPLQQSTSIMIAIPFMMLCIAHQLKYWIEHRKSDELSSNFSVAIFLAILCGLIVTVLNHEFDNVMSQSEKIMLISLSVITVYGAIGIITNYYYHGLCGVPFAFTILLIFPLLITALSVLDQNQTAYSEKKMASLVNQRFSRRPVFMYYNDKSFASYYFYSQHPVYVVRHGDKKGGAGADTQLTPTRLRNYASKNAVIIVLPNGKRLMNFYREMQPIEFCEVFRDGHTLLLSNLRSDCG